MTTKEKLALARGEARAKAEHAKDTSIDTLLIVDKQLEQTRNDNKKLYAMNETLDEAEAHMAELEKGFWNISSSGREIELPEMQDGDVEVPTLTLLWCTIWG